MKEPGAEEKVLEANEWEPIFAYRKEDEYYLHYTMPPMRGIPPVTPMAASVMHGFRGNAYACRQLSTPFTKTDELVLYLGRPYAAPFPVTDEDEIRSRMMKFGRKLKDFMENWPERYQECCDEWRKGLEYLASVEKDKLSLEELLQVLKDALRISKRNYELHFVFMHPAIVSQFEFKELCKRYGINEADIAKLLQGFPTKQTERSRELWQLANLAKEYGIADIFTKAGNTEEILDKIKETDKGRLWLEEFHKSLGAYGRFSPDMIFVGDPYCVTWLENPSAALASIRTYVTGERFDFDENSRKLAAGREDFIEECIGRIEQPGEKEAFLGRLRVQQTINTFFEDHAFYCEEWTSAEVRYVLLECGKRLVKCGILDDANDVFYLIIVELREVLEELIYDEETAVDQFGRRLPSLVRERKERWNKLHEVEAPLTLGTLPEGPLRDPLMVDVWGLTDDFVRGRAEKKVIGETIAGLAGAPGVAQGTATVVLEMDKIGEVPPGSILVTSYTTTHWTPVFSIIKGIVTDVGTLLSHSAICAREYGIPAVVDTVAKGIKATDVIKTGQLIRVDGTSGIVTIVKS